MKKYKVVIGIIGKVGSGKSTCIKYILEKYNAILFSCDEIAKELIENKTICFEIGDPIDFFTNKNKQEECRTIVHKPVFDRISENITMLYSKKFLNINNFYTQLVIIESALPDDNLFEMCDTVINIETAYEKCLERLKENRNYSEEKSKIIYESQEYYDKFYKKADYKIINDGDTEKLKNKIDGVMNEIHIVCK